MLGFTSGGCGVGSSAGAVAWGVRAAMGVAKGMEMKLFRLTVSLITWPNVPQNANSPKY